MGPAAWKPAWGMLALSASLWAGQQHAALVTVLLDFEAPHSEASVAALQQEAQRLLGEAGIRIQVGMRDETPPSAVFEKLLLFHMKGRCAMDPYPVLFDERGPLAMTYTSNGVILPFGEIRCDQVKISLKRTFTGSDYQHGDALLGTALGRVLVHEMYHILAGTGTHTSHGVTRECLSSEALRAPSAWIGAEALARLRTSPVP